MASPTLAMVRILRARREQAPPRTTTFETYAPAYREVLTEIRSLGGDPAIDELAAWITEHTQSTGSLPPPAVVRARARTICRQRGIALPPDSPLEPGEQ